MHQEFLMGNEAIAMGAIAAGVNLVCGYPGTPSTEVLETVAKHRGPDCYVEWSVNEKVAMEVAGGAVPRPWSLRPLLRTPKCRSALS